MVQYDVWVQMVNHCLREFPYEACGLLSGKNCKSYTVWMMENIRRTPVSFEMDTEQIQHVFQLIKNKGEDLIGIYHSHPTAPPFPSANDIDHAPDPELAYIIVSLAKRIPEIGCFRIQNRQVIPLVFKLFQDH
nr:M67 family metallopeptidase [Paenactinomyces guangxiensis]